jgi:putative ABC transport system permease protein
MTVVGVVADVKEDRFNFRIARPVWYLPYAQFSTPVSLSVAVRATGDPVAVARDVRAALRAVEGQMSLSHVATMADHVGDLLAAERFSALLMSVLAGIGLFLATGGLYCVIASTVSRRTAEIGLRMALGARRADVTLLVIRQGVRLVAVGLVVGCAAARLAGLAIVDTLYEVNVNDPRTYALVAGALGAVAVFACYLPSRRAARVDPLVALRGE